MDCSLPGSLLSMGFSKQEYWSGFPFPPPGDLPNSGIKPTSLLSPPMAGRFFTTNVNQEVGGKKHEIFWFFFCKHFTSERLSFCQILPQKVLLPARFYLRNSFCEILSQILLLTVRFLPQNHLVSVRFYQRPLVSVRFYLITFIFLTDLTPECSSFCQSLPRTHMSCQILSQKPLLCVRFYL